VPLLRTTLRGTRRQGGPTPAIRRAALADGGLSQRPGPWLRLLSVGYRVDLTAGKEAAP